MIFRTKIKNVNKKMYSIYMKGISSLLLVSMLNLVIVIPGERLLADPVYDSYTSSSADNVQGYIDRAHRLQDEGAWETYVRLGVASEMADWEIDSYDKLNDQIKEIKDSNLDEAEESRQINQAWASYDAARRSWELDAEEHILEERGAFIASQEIPEFSELIELERVSKEAYTAMVAEVEASVLSSPVLDLSLWDSEMDRVHGQLEDDFMTNLDNSYQTASSRSFQMSEVEKTAFMKTLDQEYNRLKSLFTFKDSFYIKRSRNRYITRMTADDVSARLLADNESAEAIGQEVIDSTIDDLDQTVVDPIQSADEMIASLDASSASADIETSMENWEEYMESVISDGLVKWEEAEKELYANRLAWLEEVERSREEAEEIWSTQHEALQAEKEKWISDIREQILEGRALWEAKFQEFRDNRAEAEAELDRYIEAEKQRWDDSSDELGAMVTGGGTALMEAKDAYNYYTRLIKFYDEEGIPDGMSQYYNFINQSRDSLELSIANFYSILDEAGGIVKEAMVSEDNSTGLLYDARLYAGDLPQRVEQLIQSASNQNFSTELIAFMNSESEDFLLYQRDIESLIETNSYFVSRATELNSSSSFDFSGADSESDLLTLINSLDDDYWLQKEELYKIYNHSAESFLSRSELDSLGFTEDKVWSDLTEQQRLAITKKEITAWFSFSLDEGGRLKSEVHDYFSEGLGMYYLTGNENDPYMMTEAEYTWELLRRERNYAAENLRKAEAVKYYADLAETHDAGNEIAGITGERAEIARVRMELAELYYKSIAGTIDLSPASTDPTLTDAERTTSLNNDYNRLLSEKGINGADLLARNSDLVTEMDIFQSIANGSSADAETFKSRLEAFLSSYSDAAEGDYRTAPVKEMILRINSFLANQDATAASDIWTSVKSVASMLHAELSTLYNEYDFAGITQDLNAFRSSLGEKSVSEFQEDIVARKALIEADAIAIESAQEAFDVAREAYFQADVDFRILSSPEKAALIQKELEQSTSLLAAIVNGMAKIETEVPVEYLRSSATATSGNDYVTDPVMAAGLEAVYEASLVEKYDAEKILSTSLLNIVQGLEASERRRENLEALRNYYANKTGRGDDLISFAEFLVASDEGDDVAQVGGYLEQSFSVDAALQSGQIPVNMYNNLKSLAEHYRSLEDEKLGLDATSDAERISEIDSEILLTQSQLGTAIEALFVAVAGEEKTFRDLVSQLFTETGATSSVDPVALKSRIESESEDLDDEIQTLSASFSEYLYTFFSNQPANQRTYEDLLNAAKSSVSETSWSDLTTGSVWTAAGYGSATVLDINNNSTLENQIHGFMLIQYILANQSTIEMLNESATTAFPMSQEEKWTAFVSTLQKDNDQTGYYADFQTLMDDSKDAWIADFKSEREQLISSLQAILAQDVQTQYNSFQSLSLENRELAARYGDVDPIQTRTSLNTLILSMRADIARVDRNYESYYRLEKQEEASSGLQSLQSELGSLQWEKTLLETERSTLTLELSDTSSMTAEQVASIESRLLSLETELTTINNGIDPLLEEYINLNQQLKEATDPGSTISYYSLASQFYTVDQTELAVVSGALETIANSDSIDSSFEEPETVYYETLWEVIGGTSVAGSPEALEARLEGGNITGSELASWSEKIRLWAKDQINNGAKITEVSVAVDMVENAYREYLSAIKIIELSKRSESTTALLAEVSAEVARIDGVRSKLDQFIQFESDLAGIVSNASTEGSGVMDALLGKLNSKQAVLMLQLFDGYDVNDLYDGYTDATISARSQEMSLLLDRVIEHRVDDKIVSAAEAYQQYQSDNLALGLGSGGSAINWFDLDDFLNAHPELDTSSILQELDDLYTMGPQYFRESVLSWLDSGSHSEDATFVALVVQAMTDTTIANSSFRYGGPDGTSTANNLNYNQNLYNAIKSSLQGLQSTIDSRLNDYASSVDQQVSLARDLSEIESIADAIDLYTARGSYARANFGDTVVASITGTEDHATLKTTLETEINSVFAETIYTGLKEDLLAIVEFSGDPTSLKSELESYLSGLADIPSGSSTYDEIVSYLNYSQLAGALTIFSSSYEYSDDDYADELERFLLLRAYSESEAAYEAYLKDFSSDVDSIAENALLNVSGYGGEFENRILLRDLEYYLTGNLDGGDGVTPGSGGEIHDPSLFYQEGTRSVSDFASVYATERHVVTNSSIILEKLSHLEYQRIQDAASAFGGLAFLDERDFATDFNQYLFLAKVKDYVEKNGIVAVGATAADQYDNFINSLEGIFSDVSYNSADGVTLGERYASKAAREAELNRAWNWFATGQIDLAGYLPDSLDALRADGALDFDYPSGEEMLPAELLAIVDYKDYSPAAATTKNYRDVLKADAGEEMYRTLALLETSGGLLDGSLIGQGIPDDYELGLMLASSGYDGVSAALEAEIKTLLQDRSVASNYGVSSSAATSLLRTESVVEYYLGVRNVDEGTFEGFMGGASDVIARAESLFFDALADRSEATQDLAKLRRGAFLEGLIALAKGSGVNDSLFTGYSASEKAAILGEMQTMKGVLFGSGIYAFSSEDQDALKGEGSMFGLAFDVRSGVELVNSGLFASAENGILAAFTSQANDSGLETFLANRTAFTSDFIKYVYSKKVSGYTYTSANITNYSSIFSSAYSTLSPSLIQTLVDEKEMMTRMLTYFLEDHATFDGQSVVTLLDGLDDTGKDLNPFFDQSLSSATIADRLLLEQERVDLSASIVGTVQAHQQAFEERQLAIARDRYSLMKGKSFLMQRGFESLSDNNFDNNRYINYRTVAGSEAEYLKESYKDYLVNTLAQDLKDGYNYLADINIGPTTVIADWVDDFLSRSDYRTVNPAAVSSKDTNGLKSFAEYFGGLYFNVETVSGAGNPESLIVSGNWDSVLRSDAMANYSVDLNNASASYGGIDTSTADEESEIFVRTVRSSASSADGMDTREAYFGSVADNYLEAISSLNESLLLVFRSSRMADDRLATDNALAMVSDFRSSYNVNDTQENSLSALTKINTDAISLAASHTDSTVKDKLLTLGNAQAAKKSEASKYAQAGRRKLVMNLSLDNYVNTVLAGAMANYNAARSVLTQAQDKAMENQIAYTGELTSLTNAMNDMASRFRDLEQLRNEYEIRSEVEQYASTPYLYSSSEPEDPDAADSDADPVRGDAAVEYEIALAMYNAAQEALSQQGYEVLFQDNFDDFEDILSILEQGLLTLSDGSSLDRGTLTTTLTDAERETLVKLREELHRDPSLSNDPGWKANKATLEKYTLKDLYERYEDLIEGRSDFIKESLRQIRLEKAAMLLETEINLRVEEAARLEQEFKDALQNAFPVVEKDVDAAATKIRESNNSSGGTMTQDEAEELVLQSRVAVYLRMQELTDSNANFYDVYRTWYWNMGDWADSVEQDWQSQVTNAAVYGGSLSNFLYLKWDGFLAMEAASGLIASTQMSEEDGAALAAYFEIGGTINEYTTFQSQYYSYLQSLSTLDFTWDNLVLTKNIYGPLITIDPTAIGKILTATWQVYLGVYNALNKYNTAQSSAQKPTGLDEVRDAQQRYAQALAALEYFTKAPDLATLKTRVMEWGSNHQEVVFDVSGVDGLSAEEIATLNQYLNDGKVDPLYQIQEEDLAYLFDTYDAQSNPIYINSGGSTFTPSEDVTENPLNVESLKNLVYFKDAFGRRYDYSSITTTQPGALSAGYYVAANGDRYSKIMQLQGDGSYRTAYARIVDSEANRSDYKLETYDMRDVLSSLSTHGENLRQEARSDYYLAGDSSDSLSLVLNDREATLSGLLDDAADDLNGGMEYRGYSLLYQEYLNNASQVYETELNQRAALQRAVWDLEEQQLQESYLKWEAKMETILNRGSQAWTDSSNSFLQEWRRWQKDFNEKEANGIDDWNKKIEDVITARETWVANIRENATKETIEKIVSEAVADLNEQMQNLSYSIGFDMETLDASKLIDEAWAEARRDLPPDADTFKSINESINQINTTLAVSEMSSGNLLARSHTLSAKMQKAMIEHQANMSTLSKVKAFEEYRKLSENMKEAVDKQNKSVETQTSLAASSEGYTKQGDQYVKLSMESGVAGVVDVYHEYDRTKIDTFLEEAGFDSDFYGDELVTFLKTKSDVEVEAYFYTQKLAMQVVMDKVFGKGNDMERDNDPTNEENVGDIGIWIGQAPNQEAARAATALAGSNASNAKLFGSNGNNADLSSQYAISAVSSGGFGELGAAGTRPGGTTAGGFYVQLQLMSQYVENGNQKHLDKLAGTRGGEKELLKSMAKAAVAGAVVGTFVGGPAGALAGAGIGAYGVLSLRVNSEIGERLGGVFNLLNVGNYADMVYNVEAANRFQNKKKGYMWEAQGIAMSKSAVTTAGAAAVGVGTGMVVGAGWTGAGAVAGGALAAVGASAVILGNSTNVDTRTGERSTKMTDQAAINSAITIGGAAASAGFGSGIVSPVGQMVVSGAVSATTIAASNGAHYDQNGNYQNFDLSGAAGDHALSQFAVSMAASMVSKGVSSQFAENSVTGSVASSIASTSTSNVLSNAIARYRGEYTRVSGAEALGAGVGEALNLVWSAKSAHDRGEALEQKKLAMTEVAVEMANQANDTDQKQRAVEILQGLGYSKDEAERQIQVSSSSRTLAQPLGPDLPPDFGKKFTDDYMKRGGDFWTDSRAETDALIQNLAENGVDVTELEQRVNAHREAAAQAAAQQQANKPFPTWDVFQPGIDSPFRSAPVPEREGIDVSINQRNNSIVSGFSKYPNGWIGDYQCAPTASVNAAINSLNLSSANEDSYLSNHLRYLNNISEGTSANAKQKFMDYLGTGATWGHNTYLSQANRYKDPTYLYSNAAAIFEQFGDNLMALDSNNSMHYSDGSLFYAEPAFNNADDLKNFYLNDVNLGSNDVAIALSKLTDGHYVNVLDADSNGLLVADPYSNFDTNTGAYRGALLNSETQTQGAIYRMTWEMAYTKRVGAAVAVIRPIR